MSNDIINFYKKTSSDEVQIDEVTPVVEPIIEKVEEVSTDPFQGFLQTLAENIEKTKASEFQKTEEQSIPEAQEDPFKKFLTNVAGIIKKDAKVQTDEQIKEATIEFINKLKDEPEAVKEEVSATKKQKKSYLPKKFLKKQPKKITSTPVEIKTTLPAINLETGLPEGRVVEQVEDDVQTKKEEAVAETDNTYVKELKTADKSKKLPDKITKPGDIKSLIEKQVREQVNKLRVELGQAAMTAGGGGTVAVQYADGGTMNGDLNVTGKYLSGGRDLATIFTGGGGGSSDRLISGAEQLVLNLDGSVTFPDNVIRPTEDSIITLESENTALSAFSRVALSPYAFFAYDGNSNSITFDSIDNTITLTSQDQYEWKFNDKGELIGPSNVLTVNSTLSTIGKILSGGRDLADIFLTSETDSQTLSYESSSYKLSISNGNTVSLSSLANEPGDVAVNTLVRASSGNWNEAYTNIVTNSAAYLSSVDLSFLSVSGHWNTAFDVATVYQNASSTWQDTSTSWSGVSATSVVEFNDTRFAKLSGQVFTFDQSVSSTDTVYGINTASGIFSSVLGGNCNTASGRYSTIVSGFSSCATDYATFVGGGSGTSAAGPYAVAVGGMCNTTNSCYGFIGGGRCNIASSFSVVGGGNNNRACGGNFTTVAGGASNTASTYGATVGGGSFNSSGRMAVVAGGCINNACGGCSFIGAGARNTVTLSNTYGAIIVGGFCNTSSNRYAAIVGGLGNYNPLRDSTIVGGTANHTGGFAHFNITTASISGNGTQTRLTGSGIQSCFSSPFTTNNVSVFYSTPAVPLSAGCFTTATIAATGSNFIVINGDYSTCTASGLSANSIYVYDRAINNTGYNNVIGGGKINTASGCYGFIGGGRCNAVVTGVYNAIVSGDGNRNCSPSNSTIAGGNINTITSTGNFAFVAGGRQNTVSNWYSSVIGGAFNTVNGQNSIIGGQNNCIGGSNAGILAGKCNLVNTNGSFIGAGVCGVITTSSAYSTIVGGKFNYNPLCNSDIHGGSYNHTGGFISNNITTTSISGNGSQTALIQSGIGSRFSASNTTGAVSIVWMTSGTANSPLSSSCFTVANVVTNAANCIVINGDYSTCTATGLSACSIYVYDRCAGNTGRNNFIGNGILNTASGCYSFIGGGTCNLVTGNGSVVIGGTLNTSSGSCAVTVGGCCNTASGSYSSVLGGSLNLAAASWGAVVGGTGNCVGGYSFVGGGYNNRACGNSGNSMSVIAGGRENLTTGSCSGYSAIGGGCCNLICANGDRGVIAGGGQNCVTNFYGTVVGGRRNTASGAYSFVAGGSANDTKGFTNTFILGTGLSASRANYTYVNNLSVQGNIASNTTYTVTAYLSATTTVPTNADLWLPLSVRNDPNNWVSNIGTSALSGIITPTVPGYYMVNYQIAWNSTTGTGQNNAQIRSNGTNTKSIAQMPLFTGSGAAQTQTQTAIVYLNGTSDSLNFSAYSSGTGQTVVGTADGSWTKVEVFKIN